MNNLIKSASRIVSKAAYFGVAWAVLTALMSETGLQTASATGGSLKLIATIDVGVLPGDIAVTPDGKYLYIANYESDTVSVIDTSLKTVSSTIALPSVLGPTNIVITADGTTAFVLAGSGIFVISTATNQIVNTIPDPASTAPNPTSSVPSFYTDIAVTLDGTQLYASNFDGTASIIDVASGQVEKTFTVGYNADIVAISPDGKSAYVGANAASGPFYLTKIDVASQTIVAPQFAQSKRGTSGYLGFSPNSQTVYFPGSRSVLAVNAVTGRRERNFVPSNETQETELAGVAISSNGKLLYVADTDANTVTIFNTRTWTQVGTPVSSS
jgi:YVTN family beta-propeller protein